jgi:hypothetical protein
MDYWIVAFSSNDLLQLFHGDGLDQVAGRGEGGGLGNVAGVLRRGEDVDAAGRVAAVPEGFQEGKAVHARHVEVEQHQVGAIARHQAAIQEIQGVAAVAQRQYLDRVVNLFDQQPGQVVAGRVVVYQHDAFYFVTGRIGAHQGVLGNG